ncbi:DUF5686 family protein [Xylanibacter muris]|nr:DUF5686 family protein [Xylanibacter muris]
MIMRAVYIVLMLIMVVPVSRAQLNSGMSSDTGKWYNRTHSISEVTVRSKRAKYSRKNNPAVELMRKVIAARKLTDLKQKHDFYRYEKYRKLTLAANDVTPSDFHSGLLSIVPDIINLVEPCQYNNKLILPVTFSETVTESRFRRRPHTVRDDVKGERSGGISTLTQSGKILDEALKDFFSDVNIYDNQVRLLHHTFTSPIGKDAIGFYRFFIIDTLLVERDKCFHLYFSPNNPMDFGFSGDIFVMADSTYRVRRCELSIPKHSSVNFVDGMRILQDFGNAGTEDEWVLMSDDMIVELRLFDFIQKGIVIRNTRFSGFDFSPLPDEAFSLRGATDSLRMARLRDRNFWNTHRMVELTGSERGMDGYFEELKKKKFYRLVMPVFRLLAENFIETGTSGKPSRVDIGPVNTFVSNNFIDGFRMRLGAQTTANLNRRLFVGGYYAHGFESKKDYYKADVTYSFRDKDYMPHEFPMRNISFTSSYDVVSPSDKFMKTDKDNVFTSLKWATVDKMMFSLRNRLAFVREEEWGLRSTLLLTCEKNEACGMMTFVPMSVSLPSSGDGFSDGRAMRTTELRAELRYAPGEKTVSTKQRSVAINCERPVYTLSHAVGLRGVMGGEYNYNFTEVSVYHRIRLNSWGKLNLNMHAGAQWNKVPYPLLIMPAANMSYIIQPSTFNLINNMEFLNDRYVSLDAEWDINGKLFNRIPLIKKLKLREYVGVKVLWGSLTDKNNPFLPCNAGSARLMYFPDGCNVMDSSRPYVELAAGVHNVFRFFSIQYVRRLNYLDLPTATKHGVRIAFQIAF